MSDSLKCNKIQVTLCLTWSNVWNAQDCISVKLTADRIGSVGIGGLGEMVITVSSEGESLDFNKGGGGGVPQPALKLGVKMAVTTEIQPPVCCRNLWFEFTLAPCLALSIPPPPDNKVNLVWKQNNYAGSVTDRSAECLSSCESMPGF